MKNITLLVLLFTGIVKAQIVSIPDANFKALLLASNATDGIAMDTSFGHIEVDTNQDGEIQLSEAQMVYAIDIQTAAINSLEGIGSFTNLGWFRCLNTNIATVDLSQNTNLTKLQLNDNQLTSLDVTMLTGLQWLTCSNNQLTTLNVLPLVNLTLLDCRSNLLTGLNVSTLAALTEFDCSRNLISAIDVSALTNVTQLVLQNNDLNTIDVSLLSNLLYLYVGVNHLTTLDISALQNLTIVDASFNQLTTLDCNNNTHLTFVGCSNNNLETLFIKNGAIEGELNNQYVFSNNPSLTYICADDNQIESIQNELNSIGNTITVVGSYCTVPPGGAYSTVTGIVHFDADTNGCDSNDAVQSLIKMTLNVGANQGSTFTNTAGNYTFFVQNVNILTIAPNIENPSFFTLTPSQVVISSPLNPVSTADFCIAPNGVHRDLEIVLTPIIPARPGFDAVYKIVYKNKGNQVMSDSAGIIFSYNPSIMSVVDTSEPITATGSESINFGYANLNPFESKSIVITMHINSPIDTPPVSNGDILHLSASIGPANLEETPDDNYFVLDQTVVGSFDPNEIVCLEGTNVAPTEIGKYLHYNVQFENTGTASAVNIVVKDIIDPTQYDINSLRVLNASHPVYTRISGNVVEFIFEGIDLPAGRSTSDPVLIGGHGNVLFKMKSINSLLIGDHVNNRADIFFDYNAPIATNDATTTFALLSNGQFIKDNSIRVYPNPAKNNITIVADHVLQSIQLYDIQGRLLETTLNSATTTTLDISKRANGIYFIKASSTKGSTVEKIVKE